MQGNPSIGSKTKMPALEVIFVDSSVSHSWEGSRQLIDREGLEIQTDANM